MLGEYTSAQVIDMHAKLTRKGAEAYKTHTHEQVLWREVLALDEQMLAQLAPHNQLRFTRNPKTGEVSEKYLERLVKKLAVAAWKLATISEANDMYYLIASIDGDGYCDIVKAPQSGFVAGKGLKVISRHEREGGAIDAMNYYQAEPV